MKYYEQHKDKIRLWLCKENLYSKGLKPVLPVSCRGKYIARCDGDDYWTDPYKLQKQVDYMEAHPDCVITGHDAKMIDSSGKLIKDSILSDYCKQDASAKELKMGFWILNLSMLMRNVPIFLNYPKEGSKVKNGDTFLISMLGQFGSYHYMPEITPAVYREHEGGVWSMIAPEKKIYASMFTKYFTALYFKRTNDPIAKKLYLNTLNKGMNLFANHSAFVKNMRRTEQKKYIKALVISHFHVYGWLRSLKFTIHKIYWYYFKSKI
jgi:glycosyltransferase involved in cell wall biosynthesis